MHDLIASARSTMTGVCRRARPIMLGIAPAALLCACESGVYRTPDFRLPGPASLNDDRTRGADLAQPMAATPRREPVTREETRQADPEPDVPAFTPSPVRPRVVQPRVPEPPDSGAIALVDSIVGALGDPQQGEDGVTRIGLTALRNQSRSTRDEFQVMRAELMDLLTAAGRDRRIVFTDAQEIAVQYHLEGAAYRFDNRHEAQWELFLQLMRDDDGMMVWEPTGAVRMRVSADGRMRLIAGG